MKCKVDLRHVPINQGGYDSRGGYWGTGERLYWYAFELDGREYSQHIRATDRKQAKERIRALWPKRDMRFYN